jgi:hypothetical protein
MFCLSGQKGRDAMNTDGRIGGGISVPRHRHPLLSRISVFLGCLGGMMDPFAKRRVRWTPMASAMAAVLMALDRGCPLNVRFEDAAACMSTDFSRPGPRGGRTTA